MTELPIQWSLRRRYEAVRRQWCSGEGYAGDAIGIGVLLHAGMCTWMGQQVHLEPLPAHVHPVAPSLRAHSECGDDLAPRSVHSEATHILATMAIAAVKEST